MTFGLSSLLLIAMFQAPLPAKPMSREEAIASLETSEIAKDAFYACFYDAKPSATRDFVISTDPYFSFDGSNSAASKFSSEISTETLFAKCAIAMSAALPKLQTMSVTFDIREYRYWAARRVYIERHPDTRTFGKLQKPKRKLGNYGDNADAIASLLRTVDCAVQRDPVTADWLVRNSSSIQLRLGSAFLSNANKFEDAYYKCANQSTPSNGVTEVMNNLGGILADSLLNMPAKQ